MKKLLFPFIFFIGTWASAHSGHPGTDDHGAFTHLAIGLATAMPLVGIAWGLYHLRSAKRARVNTTKDSTHG